MDKQLKLSDLLVKAEDCFDPADYVLVHKDHLARLQRGRWGCKAQPAADPPQDCGWPDCGCDPNVERVIQGLQECGYTIMPPGNVDYAILVSRADESGQVTVTSPGFPDLQEHGHAEEAVQWAVDEIEKRRADSESKKT